MSLQTLPQYETYKDSGIEWLGKIPEHWSVKRFKFLLNEINDRSDSGGEVLLSLSKYKGVIPKDTLDERSGGAATLVGYKRVYKNHLVILSHQCFLFD